MLPLSPPAEATRAHIHASSQQTTSLRRWFGRSLETGKASPPSTPCSAPEGKSCYGFPTPDAVLIGPEAFKAVHRTFCGAFPKQKIVVEDLLAEDDGVAVRWQVTMTHSGETISASQLPAKQSASPAPASSSSKTAKSPKAGITWTSATSSSNSKPHNSIPGAKASLRSQR